MNPVFFILLSIFLKVIQLMNISCRNSFSKDSLLKSQSTLLMKNSLWARPDLALIMVEYFFKTICIQHAQILAQIDAILQILIKVSSLAVVRIRVRIVFFQVSQRNLECNLGLELEVDHRYKFVESHYIVYVLWKGRKALILENL